MQFQTLTDFEGLEQAAALSATAICGVFYPDRDGQMDVWVTQVGSVSSTISRRQRTRTSSIHPSVHWAFSPDGSLRLRSGCASRSGGRERRRHQHPGRAHPGVDPRGPTRRHRPSSTGSHDALGSRTTRLARRSPLRLRRPPANRHPPIFVALPESIVTSRYGRPTTSSSTLCREPFPDKLDIWRIGPHRWSPRTPHYLQRPRHPSRPCWIAVPSCSRGRSRRSRLCRSYSMDIERRIPHRLGSSLDATPRSPPAPTVIVSPSPRAF